MKKYLQIQYGYQRERKSLFPVNNWIKTNIKPKKIVYSFNIFIFTDSNYELKLLKFYDKFVWNLSIYKQYKPLIMTFIALNL